MACKLDPCGGKKHNNSKCCIECEEYWESCTGCFFIDDVEYTELCPYWKEESTCKGGTNV